MTHQNDSELTSSAARHVKIFFSFSECQNSALPLEIGERIGRLVQRYRHGSLAQRWLQGGLPIRDYLTTSRWKIVSYIFPRRPRFLTLVEVTFLQGTLPFDQDV